MMTNSVPLKSEPKQAAEVAIIRARELGYIPSLKYVRRKEEYVIVCRKPKNLWQHFWFRVLAFFRR